MRLFLAAQDFGPSSGLDLLQKELEEKGHRSQSLLGFGNQINITEHISEVEDSLKAVDYVVLGMSSSSELSSGEIEIAYIASTLGVPIALYADSFQDCLDRPWFEPIRKNVSLLLLATTSEIESANKLYPHIGDNCIFVTGNPLWEQARYVPRSRKDTRASLSAGEKKVVFVPLIKNPAVNLALLSAGFRMTENYERLMLVNFHPGDKTSRFIYRNYLPDNNKVHFLPEKSLKKYLQAADVVLNGTSTIGLEAILGHNIPVIEYLCPAVVAEMTRIYPSGWKLPEHYPDMATWSGNEKLDSTVEEVLEKEIVWTGVVGEPSVNPAVTKMIQAVTGGRRVP